MSPERTFDEAVAKAILRRATEMEARTNQMTESELRSIADELGMPQQAIDDALKEFDQFAQRKFTNGRSWRQLLGAQEGLPILSAGAGVVIGLVMFVLDGIMPRGTDVGAIGMTLTLFPYLALMVSVRGEKRHALFQKSNFVLWGAMFFMGFMLQPMYLDIILVAAASCCSATAILGGLVVEARHQAVSKDVHGSSGSTGTNGSSFKSIRKALKRRWENFLTRFSGIIRNEKRGESLMHGQAFL